MFIKKAKKEDQKYYFITVFETVDLDETEWPDYGASRTWGFYKDKNTALKALHENWTDMWERCYNYAILETYEEGISRLDFSYRQFFRFDRQKGGYVEIEEPVGYNHIAGFAYG